MEKRWIFLIFFVLLVISGVVVVYLFYEKPLESEIEGYSNITISSTDLSNDKQVETSYLIQGKDIQFSKRGNTSKEGSILLSVPSNHTYYVYNINKENQNYYSSKREIIIPSTNVYWIKMGLIKPSSISLSRQGKFNGKDNLSIIIDSNGYYQKIVYCLKWGLRIIDISQPINFTKIEVPLLYSSYFDCYQTNTSLKGVFPLEIPLDYTYWETLGDEDFIRIVVMDSDFVNGTYITELGGKDVGGKNKEYEIRI